MHHLMWEPHRELVDPAMLVTLLDGVRELAAAACPWDQQPWLVRGGDAFGNLKALLSMWRSAEKKRRDTTAKMVVIARNMEFARKKALAAVPVEAAPEPEPPEEEEGENEVMLLEVDAAAVEAAKDAAAVDAANKEAGAAEEAAAAAAKKRKPVHTPPRKKKAKTTTGRPVEHDRPTGQAALDRAKNAKSWDDGAPLGKGFTLCLGPEYASLMAAGKKTSEGGPRPSRLTTLGWCGVVWGWCGVVWGGVGVGWGGVGLVF